MADGDLSQAEFDLAFAFSRPLAAAYRNGAGVLVQAAIDAPRFDHDATGAPLGLLIEPGSWLGAADRPLFDPLMLPDDMAGREATILQEFDDGRGAELRRAFYTRNAVAAIGSLMRQAGHHRALGVIDGFAPNMGGHVRYRGQSWYLPRIVGTGMDGFALGDGEGHALIEAGAETP
ncbi:MAG: hypothetical protein R3E02_10055 [Blastomonas sp.]